MPTKEKSTRRKYSFEWHLIAFLNEMKWIEKSEKSEKWKQYTYAYTWPLRAENERERQRIELKKYNISWEFLLLSIELLSNCLISDSA